MTPEEAFDAAMRYENRANPYPYFDELRKTPVVRVTNGSMPSPGTTSSSRWPTTPG